jgi:hypothetical protein
LIGALSLLCPVAHLHGQAVNKRHCHWLLSELRVVLRQSIESISRLFHITDRGMMMHVFGLGAWCVRCSESTRMEAPDAHTSD